MKKEKKVKKDKKAKAEVAPAEEAPKKEKKDKKDKKDKKAKKAEAAAATTEDAAKKAKKEKKEKKRKAEEEAAAAAALEEKKAKKEKKEKKEKKAKKAKEPEPEPEPVDDDDDDVSDEDDSDDDDDDDEDDAPIVKKGGAAAGGAAASAASGANPEGITKCFVGNLSWHIDEETLKGWLEGVSSIDWMVDRDTQRFKGCAWVEFESAEHAAAAVALNGTEIMERAAKIEFARPKPGGERSPARGAKAQGESIRAQPLKPKPEGCVTCFAGNLSWEIDDDACRAFFEGCGPIERIKWLTDRETGEFKGCGFITFETEAALDKAVALRGEELLGRAIKLDYADPPKPRTW